MRPWQPPHKWLLRATPTVPTPDTRLFRSRSRSRSRDRDRDRASAKSKKLHVGKLTRNVNTSHLHEIFGHYGKVKSVEIVTDKKVRLCAVTLTMLVCMRPGAPMRWKPSPPLPRHAS